MFFLKWVLFLCFCAEIDALKYNRNTRLKKRVTTNLFILINLYFQVRYQKNSNFFDFSN